jgi:hypothetical protein
MEKDKKKCFQAQKLKITDESNMAAIFFFLSELKNDNTSKSSFLLYFLTKNTTFVEQFFFSKNSK